LAGECSVNGTTKNRGGLVSYFGGGGEEKLKLVRINEKTGMPDREKTTGGKNKTLCPRRKTAGFPNTNRGKEKKKPKWKSFFV